MIEVLKQALEALESCGEGHITDGGNQWHDAKLIDTAITSLRQAIAKAEDNYQGSDAAKAAHMMDLYTALGVRWGDDPFAVIAKMRSIAELESQEPVAWMHTKIDGVAVPHRPSDLDKHPERWKALYKTPPPCPTCEALARTVMLDQTSHDIHPPQRTWVGLTHEEIASIGYNNHPLDGVRSFARAIEAKLKERNL